MLLTLSRLPGNFEFAVEFPKTLSLPIDLVFDYLEEKKIGMVLPKVSLLGIVTIKSARLQRKKTVFLKGDLHLPTYFIEVNRD